MKASWSSSALKASNPLSIGSRSGRDLCLCQNRRMEERSENAAFIAPISATPPRKHIEVMIGVGAGWVTVGLWFLIAELTISDFEIPWATLIPMFPLLVIFGFSAYETHKSRLIVGVEGIAAHCDGRDRQLSWSEVERLELATKWWRPHPRLIARKGRSIAVPTNWAVEPAEADLLDAVVAHAKGHDIPVG